MSSMQKTKKMIYEEEQGYKLTNIGLYLHSQKQNKLLICVANSREIVILYYLLDKSSFTVALRLLDSRPPPFHKTFSFQYNCIHFYKRQKYILVGATFGDKLYFVRIWSDYCEKSKRVKFPLIIEELNQISNDGILVILNSKTKEANTKRIILTHEDNIASFTKYQNYHLIVKFTLDISLSI